MIAGGPSLQGTPYLIPTALAGAFSVALAAFALRRRGRPGAASLGIVMAGTAVWALGNALQSGVTSLGGKVFWANAQYLGIVVVPAGLLVFALQYTGQGGRVTRRLVALLAIEPVAVLALAWTNPAHGLFRSGVGLGTAGSMVVLRTNHEIAFWLHAAYSYLLVGVASLLIARTFLVSDHLYRSQTLALLVAVAAPWLGNAALLAGLAPPGLHPTPIAFIVTGAALTWAVFRGELLAVAPVSRELARQKLIESLPDPAIVLDDRGRVTDLNPSARALVPGSVEDAVGEPLEAVFPELASAIDLETAPTGAAVSIDRGGGTRHYDVRVSSLGSESRVLEGHVILLRDMTPRERQRQRLEVLNRVLRHDLRNDMNVLLAYADDLGREGGVPNDRVEDIRRKGEEIAELSEKASDIEGLLVGEEVVLERVDIVEVVERELGAVRADHGAIEVETDLPERAPVYASRLIDSAVKNVLANAVEHNDRETPRIEVSVRDRGEFVDLRVADDGPGIPERERRVLEQGSETQLRHSSGLGLWLIHWIVEESGGAVDLESIDPRGTAITIRLLSAGDDPGTPPRVGGSDRPEAGYS